jgi:hypothetical protein
VGVEAKGFEGETVKNAAVESDGDVGTAPHVHGVEQLVDGLALEVDQVRRVDQLDEFLGCDAGGVEFGVACVFAGEHPSEECVLLFGVGQRAPHGGDPFVHVLAPVIHLLGDGFELLHLCLAEFRHGSG